jgi:hypothetical protein
MGRRSVFAVLLSIGLLPILLVGSISGVAGAAADTCPGGFVACGGDGQKVVLPTDLPQHHIKVKKVGTADTQPGDIEPLAGTIVAPNTCRYTTTSYGNGQYSGVATYAVDDQLGAHARSDAYHSGFPTPGTSTAAANASAGVDVIFPSNWPSGASVTVKNPWRLVGDLDVDAGVNFLGGAGYGAASYAANVILARVNGVAAGGEVASESLTTVFGPKTQHINNSGTKNIVQDVPPNSRFIDYVQISVNSYVSSSYFALGHAATEFFNTGRMWNTYQDWKFTLPSGYEISGC